jgi:hypothetical protein
MGLVGAADLRVTRRRLDLGDLGFDAGAHLLVRHALSQLPDGETIDVHGSHPELSVHLQAWCRGRAVRFDARSPMDAADQPVASLTGSSGGRESARARGARRAGEAKASLPDAVRPFAPATWGLAPRGALVEEGVPAFDFDLAERDLLWADEAAAIYAQAAAAQWDPAAAIDWNAGFTLPDEIEDAVVQIMTYLIENETAALIIPARFATRIHPHFREVIQVLAIQAADEARHVEVFTRRALMRRPMLGLSTAGGQASLKTLMEEPDFALASFLLSVLGEGSFLALLWFLQHHAPDPVTRQVARLAAQDEARHVAFGLAHLRRHVAIDPGLRGRMAAAMERRHDALRDTAGLNEEVFDSLVLLAAGSWDPDAIRTGHRKVQALQEEMDRGRRGRLQKLGYPEEEAVRLSSLHTRNFM